MRLLLVEDDPEMSRTAAEYLRRTGYAVDAVHDGASALRALRLNPCDAVILDLRLPDISGFEICRQLRLMGSQTRVLMATARDAVEDRIEGLDIGADDYLVKPYAMAELAARIRALLRRPSNAVGTVLAVNDLELDTRTRTARRGMRHIELTTKEFAVLEVLMRHGGEVVTRETISASAWDENYDPFSNVIDVYVSRLRRKIDLPEDVPLVTALRGAGYRHVFASAAPLEKTLLLIDRWLMFGIPLGFFFAGGLGWWLAERTLRPVGVMADAATQMANERRTGGVGLRETTAQRLPIDNPSDELGRLGTRFNALLDQLDGVMAQQRRFLADAAHELRTPVARMLGNVHLAQLDPDDTAGQQDALRRVRDDLDRTTHLIDELLQLARADAAGAVHTSAGYIDDVVADAVHAWQPLARKKGVQLSVVTLDEAPADIDSVYLERLIGILFDNAIRYTPANGTVEVCVSMPNGAPCLSVADTGIGIPVDDLARVFERFYRGTSARAMSPDGTGLGLPIARWIAHAHHATLELASSRGGGTVATVTFPSATPLPVPSSSIGVS